MKRLALIAFAAVLAGLAPAATVTVNGSLLRAGSVVLQTAAPTAFTPELSKTFVGTNGTGVGTGAFGADGVFYSSYSSGFGAFYSNAQTRGGRSTSMAMKISIGSDGDNTTGIGGMFGFVFDPLPTAIKASQGEWTHWGAWIYFESGFDFSTSSGYLKTLRHGKTGTTANVDILSIGTSSATTGFAFSNEDNLNVEFANSSRTTSRVIVPGQWLWIEHAVLWHSVGSSSIRRFWINDQLVMEIAGTAVKYYNGGFQTATLGSAVPTLQNSGAQHDRGGFFTYWNGNAPKTQTVWIDAIALQKNVGLLTNTDDQGNKIIGSTASIP